MTRQVSLDKPRQYEKALRLLLESALYKNGWVSAGVLNRECGHTFLRPTQSGGVLYDLGFRFEHKLLDPINMPNTNSYRLISAPTKFKSNITSKFSGEIFGMIDEWRKKQMREKDKILESKKMLF